MTFISEVAILYFVAAEGINISRTHVLFYLIQNHHATAAGSCRFYLVFYLIQNHHATAAGSCRFYLVFSLIQNHHATAVGSCRFYPQEKHCSQGSKGKGRKERFKKISRKLYCIDDLHLSKYLMWWHFQQRNLVTASMSQLTNILKYKCL